MIRLQLEQHVYIKMFVIIHLVVYNPNLRTQKVRRKSVGLGNIHGSRRIWREEESLLGSRGFIFSMDETSRHLCVLFWFCVLFFMCQQCWQSLKELCCACLRKYWCIVLQVGWRKPLNLSLIPFFNVFISTYYLWKWIVWWREAHGWTHLL